MQAPSGGVDVDGAGLVVVALPVVVEVATGSCGVAGDVVVDVVVTGVESVIDSALWQAAATTMMATPIAV